MAHEPVPSKAAITGHPLHPVVIPRHIIGMNPHASQPESPVAGSRR